MADWSPQDDFALRSLWDDGHSAAEIGRRLGRTKNSIVGRAHRLDLPSRPSPIISDGRHHRPAKPRRIGSGPSLPTLASVTTVHAPTRSLAPTLMASARPVVARPEPAPKPYGRVAECCWPMGEPGTRAFRFCDVPSMPGRPYCEGHCARAYVRGRPGEAVAA